MTASAAAAPGPRRQRRRQDKPAIPARLVLDHHTNSDVGILSGDLFADLFPHLVDSASVSQDEGETSIHHVAISPWLPDASPLSAPWSIVPVLRSTDLAPCTLRFSPSSPALQTFAAALQQLAPSKLSSHSRSGIEILVLDVSPLPLDTVYVSLESESTKRLENGERYLHHEHRNGTPATNVSTMSPEERLTAAIRYSLAGLRVVHTGDLFPLPLAPHYVTHLPPNPGKIVLCEPVAQGILDDSTRIVLMRGRVRTRHSRRQASMASAHRINGVAEEDDGAQTDQFFSAAEDPRARTDANDDGTETQTATEPDSDQSEPEQDEELSDDSMDDMLSLQLPPLPSTDMDSGAATVQPGTPMTVGTRRGRKTNGAATPASVFSNYTSATVRPDRPRGRLFKAKGLVRPIPAESLHPKPAPDEDDEARVFVDMSSLPKIGCFSGDWVRIETAEEPPRNGFGAFGLGSFGQAELGLGNWRPVRVYGLPEGYSQRPVTRISRSRRNERKLSFFESQVQRPSSPAAYASPILLANLDNTPFLRISALKKASYQGKGTLPRFTSASHPPYAKDIGIHHVRTPISAERAYQTAVLGGLKRYFACKTRLVRSGDLIAVAVDAKLGRALQEVQGGDGSEVDDIVALTAGGTAKGGRPDSVAWFKVGHVQMQRRGFDDDDDDGDGEDGSLEAFWGSVACINSTTVAMHGTGFEKSRIPPSSQSTWPYYLGLWKAEIRSAAMDIPPQPVSPLRRQLRELLAAATSPRAMHFKMPPIAILLTSNHRNIGKTTLVKAACADIGLHLYDMDAYDVLSEGGGGGSDVKTDGFLRSRAERAMSCGPNCCVLLVQHIEALTADRIESTLKEVLEETRALVATTNDVDQMPAGVRGLFTHELEMNAPDEAERERILRSAVDDGGIGVEPTMNLNSVALKTAALVAGDLVDVVERATAARRVRLEQMTARKPISNDSLPITIRDVEVAGGSNARHLTTADFDAAVEAARSNLSSAMGAPKIPKVTWDDVGGLGPVKAAITETIQLPLQRPELFARGLKKRSGILLYGPPGTGKTLLAKAIATEYSLNFFSVKGPELLNMYIGESEANVRRVFARARDARPCVVFFDELDSVAPKRGNQGDSGGVMDRIVSQLLAELDGMSGGGGGDDGDKGNGDGSKTGDGGGGGGGEGVFVIGATNRPDLLDPALLRPGRFDKMLYLGVSDTREKQVTILEALTRKFILDPTISLPTIASRLPYTYTGADFYALCSDAMLKAVTRQASRVDAKLRAINAERASVCSGNNNDVNHSSSNSNNNNGNNNSNNIDHDVNSNNKNGNGGSLLPLSTAAFFDHHATEEDVAVRVTDADFTEAQRELVPSVSRGELAHYERVRAAFEGRAGPNPSSSSHHGQGSLQRGGYSRGEDGGGDGDEAGSRDKGKGKATLIHAPISITGSMESGSSNRRFHNIKDADVVADADADNSSDDQHSGPITGQKAKAKNKGKGKARAVPLASATGGFQEGKASDDDGLY